MLIPNGAAIPDSFFLSRKELGIPDDAFVLCLASRAMPEKGWREAIEAVRLARAESGRDIHLLLLGDGEVYDELKQNAQEDFIHLTGFVENVAEYYHISDMGFLPSYFSGESMPLAVIEALCAGKPVIATEIGEIPWLLKGRDGIAGALLPVRDGKVSITEAASLITGFASDQKKYEAAAQMAAKQGTQFQITNTARRYLAAYKKALCLKKRAAKEKSA